MSEVLISPLAKADMAEIVDYIRRELHNGSAAARLLCRFREAMGSLCDYPESGARLLPEKTDRFPYRYLVCGNYLIFYHLEGRSVLVDRVIYGRRDYMAILFGDSLEYEEE